MPDRREDFIVQALANMVGTLLAAAVLYFVGLLGGVLTFDIVPFLLGVLGIAVALVQYERASREFKRASAQAKGAARVAERARHKL